MAELEIKNLHVTAADKQILKGVDLHVRAGEFHALMGPNGSGKSTLANAVMGHPNLEVTEGQILLDGEDITEADPDERARAGLFLAFQYPATIPGVSVANFLRIQDGLLIKFREFANSFDLVEQALGRHIEIT